MPISPEAKEKQRAASSAFRKRRAALGLCVGCGASRDGETSKCASCRKAGTEYIKEYRKTSSGAAKTRECASRSYEIQRRDPSFWSSRSQRQMSRRANDLNFRLSQNLRSRLSSALRASATLKLGSSIKDLGCSIGELRRFIEARFKPGMSWDNYGSWEIDHITPLAAFDLSDREQLLRACNYTNLQPLWAEENSRKGSKIYSASDGMEHAQVL